YEASLAEIIVTDVAEFMRKCGRDLRFFYPSLMHVTCICHLLHRVVDKVKDHFAD
ncbi:Uncharacterized protein FKW44_015608, partial [Caligus rogercresseyi]